MLAAEQVHQSRWGFHPCGPEEFREIKAYHKILFRDLQASLRFMRWERKLPHNRVHRHRDGRVDAIPQPKHRGTGKDYYLRVLSEYRDARKPRETPGDVWPLDLPSSWRTDFQALREFYGEA